MSMHDEMSDHEILRAAADSLSGLSIARPPDLESIMAEDSTYDGLTEALAELGES